MTFLPALILSAIRSPWRLLRAYPWQALALVLALFSWHQRDRARQWHERADAEIVQHQATKAGYVRAQALARDRAEAARQALEQRTTQLAKEADDANDQADLWRARARRFADDSGLRARAGKAAGGDASQAAAPGADHFAAGGNATGGAAVTLSRADFETLSANTERLLRVHAWGQALIAEGLAVASEER